MSSAILDQLDRYGPDQCPQLDYEQAVAYNRALAKSHYENFTVVSWLLPADLRDDFRNVYAFCRWADDLGDETGDTQRSLHLLAWWRRELDACYAGRPRHPVYVALQRTIERHDIPRKPFDDLIDAFVQDQSVLRYKTWDQVLDYCTRSADPVGRLVLYLCDYRDDQRQRLSDATCTALQLANFWQDVRRDVLERDRVYIPDDVASKHGLDIEQMVKVIRLDASCPPDCSTCDPSRQLPSLGVTALLPAYRASVRELVQRTWPLFETGRGLWPLLRSDIRSDIRLFTLGGEAILRMIERLNYNTLATRPSLGKGAKMALMFKVALGRLGAAVSGGGRDSRGGRP
jgi:squalene synthase HpnC